MSYSVPLKQMTTIEKLQALEAIWEDLASSPSNVPSPDWHGNVLCDRLVEAEGGEENYVDWEEAKRSLLNDLNED